MSEDIEIHYDPQRGELLLSCGDEAFSRLRNAVISEDQLEAIIGAGRAGDVKLVEITVVPPIRRTHQSGGVRDKVALLGCGLVSFAIVIVFGVGVSTIVNWLSNR